jgi:hypothetical protein
MDNPIEIILDVKDRKIEVGTEVVIPVELAGVATYGKVVKIVQSSVDYSDEAERAVLYNPSIEVLFRNGETDTFPAYWNGVGERQFGKEMTFICEELDVIDET